jgi:large conductance mechanosensitive channel
MECGAPPSSTTKEQQMLKEFREFLSRGSVIDLAVAVVMGAAFGALITSLVADLLTPVIAAVIGKPDFSNLTFTINGSVFRYGSFLNALISFVSIAAAIFFFVIKPVNHLRERQGKAEEEEKPDELIVLEEIRDTLKAAG